MFKTCCQCITYFIKSSLFCVFKSNTKVQLVCSVCVNTKKNTKKKLFYLLPNHFFLIQLTHFSIVQFFSCRALKYIQKSPSVLTQTTRDDVERRLIENWMLHRLQIGISQAMHPRCNEHLRRDARNPILRQRRGGGQKTAWKFTWFSALATRGKHLNCFSNDCF